MTEQTEPETDLEDTEPEQPDTDETDQDDTEPRSEEAKRYRLRLREAEGTLGEIQGQLDGIQRQVIGQLVEAECQISPEVLFAAGATVADLVDDDGTVNRDKVRQAGDNAARSLNVARSPRSPRHDPRQGDPGAAPAKRGGWEAAFKPG